MSKPNFCSSCGSHLLSGAQLDLFDTEEKKHKKIQQMFKKLNSPAKKEFKRIMKWAEHPSTPPNLDQVWEDQIEGSDDVGVPHPPESIRNLFNAIRRVYNGPEDKEFAIKLAKTL